MPFFSFAEKKPKDSSEGGRNQQAVPLQEQSHNRKETSFTRVTRVVIFIFLGILFFGISLFFTGLTVQGVIFDRYMLFLLFSLFSFVAWIIGGVYSGELTVKRTPLDIPLVLFWGVYAVSMVFSFDRWHSFWGALFDPSRGFIVVTASILLYYVVISTQTRESLYRLARFYVYGVSLLAVWGAVAISGIFEKNSGILTIFHSIPTDNLASLNFLITFTFPLMLGMFLYSVSANASLPVRIFKGVLWFIVISACLYLIAALYLSVTLIALFIGLGVFISYTSGDIVRVSKKWLWIPVVIFFAVLPIFYFLGQGILAKEGTQLQQSVLPGVQMSWEVLKNTMAENLFIGTGPATYAYAFSHFFPESLNQTSAFSSRLSQAPNYLFEMVVTTGILGGLAFLVLLIFSFSVVLFLLTQRREVNSVLSLGLWMSILVLVIIGFFYTLSGVLIFPAILLAVLAIAILFSESETRMQSITFSLRAAPQYALASTLLLLIACIGALSLFATLGKMYVADMYARQAFEMQAEQRKLAIGYIEKAIQLNPQEGQYFVFRGRMYLALANEALGKLDTKDNEKAVQEIQLFVRESVRSLVRGRNLLPGDIFSQEGLAQQLESLGSKDEAFVAYQDAEKIEPKNPIYSTRMAKIRIIQAQTEKQQERKNQYFIEADRLLEKSLAIKGNYGEAWYQKALLAESQKDMDKAIEFAQKALDTDNDIRSGLLVARLYQARGGEKDTKAAEELLNKILGVNDKEINAQLSLALLYEKTGRTQEAIDRYEKARDLLPQGAKKARDQIDEIVQGLKDGTRQQQIQSQDQGYGVDVTAPENN